MTKKWRHLIIVHFDGFSLSFGIVLVCIGLLGMADHFNLGRVYLLGPIVLALVPVIVFFSWFRACTCGISLEESDSDPTFLKGVEKLEQGCCYLLCGTLIGCRLSGGQWAALFGEVILCLSGLACIYSGAFGGAKRVSRVIRLLLSDNVELLKQGDCERLAVLARDIGEIRRAGKISRIHASKQSIEPKADLC